MNNNKSDLSRREFVKTAAVTVAATAAVPMILHAADKPASHPLVLGEGKHTYELVPGWGKLPEGKAYGNSTEDQRSPKSRPPLPISKVLSSGFGGKCCKVTQRQQPG